MIDKKIDIIIPIYNAYEELTRCIDSIWKWTDLSNNRLILINDMSPDERIREYLDQIDKKNVIVIHNEKNKGFSANINIGMEQSQENDVILLNSDTVVTKNWVEKIKACAYSDSMIATVTPLSNNATLCSVPNFCEENTVPDGYTVDEYAELIEKISMKKYPMIPVANGFCMYVKREIIEKIGNFDAETFGRGYGEENDFCYRAIEVGYHHVMCDDTFILHTGTSSFVSEEKLKYIQAHEKILDQRYPKLMQDVRIHCRDNPNTVIQENVKLWIKLDKREKRKTIMYLVQSDFREGADDNVGGTQLHVKDLVMGNRSAYDIVVAARNGAYLNVTLYTEKDEFAFKYYIGWKEAYEKFRSDNFAELYRNILNSFGVDCVHIHHTLGLTHELFYEAHKKNIPIFVTMHDFYYICPTVKLLDDSYELCIGKDSEEKCKNCLKKQLGIAETIPYITLWRKQSLTALELARQIFVPSESAKQIVSGYFAELSDKIEVIEHGSEPILTQKIEEKQKNKDTFNVAFLGGINVAKGYRYAVDMIKSSDKGIRWHLFGMFERDEHSLMNRKNFVNVGKYQREDLPELFQKYEIDLVCILPIWPETFCYTISEAVLCGIPVLVTDIGALSQRVREMDCGWIVPYEVKAKDILKKIHEIHKNNDEYQSKVHQVKLLHMKTAKEMCGIYQERYDTVITEKIPDNTQYIDYKWLFSGITVNANGRNVIFNDRDEMEARLQEVEHQLVIIENSITFRIVRKVTQINIPFKYQIKSLLQRMYRMIRKG